MEVSIGKNIKLNREKLKMSQRELARESNQSIANISRYEAGLVLPGIINAKQIADALNITVEELMK